MPRYRYQCTQCGQETDIFHLADETVSDCPICGIPETLIKVLTKFTTNRKESKNIRTGDVTENFIKEAKADLKRQKEDARNKRK